MFGLFKRKKEIQVKDFIWKNETIKYNALAKQLQQQEKFIVLYYFEDTKNELETCLTSESVDFTETNSFAAKIWVMKSSNLLQKLSADNRVLIFAEHHPSHAVEQNIKNHLAEQLAISEITFYTSFEDKLMQLFGAERILELMEKMGYKDDEMIEHSMVSKSLERAQQKIDEKAPIPSDTRLRKDWFEMNLPMP